MMKLLDLVNPLQGTYSHKDFSTGNTMPLVAVPFGMAHWTLQTHQGPGWQFNPRDCKLMGVRCTHLPSPWMRDYGAFTILPQAGPKKLSPGRRATSYRLDKTIIRPNYLAGELVTTGVRFEMAPTERCATFRFHFPEGVASRILIEPEKGESFVSVREDKRTVVGYTRGNSGGVPKEFACYLVAVCSEPIESWHAFVGDDEGPAGEARLGDAVGISLELGKLSGRPVTFHVATSFISHDQAELNLRREIGDRDLDTVANAGSERWEQTLAQIEVHDDESEERLRTFYSCLYRTQLFPRIWHELDTTGNPIHFSPYDGQVHPGVLYADTGFWDTYRTQFPLLTLLNPKLLNDVVIGFTNAYRESGWFPQWPSPGHRVSMVGTHFDSVLADAVRKGIRDFDLETALDGMIKHAEHPAPADSGAGRPGIEQYLKYGYCLAEGRASVSQTLDYAYDDWCISEVAHAIGRSADEYRFLERALNYRNIYDPSVGFMRARHADGSWKEPFDVYEWGGPYVEGGPWQSSWAVQHDLAGLMNLMGGEEAFAAKLDEMLSTPPYLHVGAYGFEIHEMTEMAMADFGQYAQSNQPVHHVLYLYHVAGKPWRTQKEVRRVMDELYTPDLFPGDEDNGEMAAWYVLNALGVFPLTPGHPSWALGSPLFRHVTVHLPNGRELQINAPNNRVANVYVEGIKFDRQAYEGLTIWHGMLSGGGALSFEMTDSPMVRAVPHRLRPYSLSAYA